MGKPEGERPLGRPRRRWESNIKKDLQEVRWRSMNWIDLAQDRDWCRALVNAARNLRVSQIVENYSTSRQPGSFSRSLLHAVSKKVSIRLLDIAAKKFNEFVSERQSCPFVQVIRPFRDRSSLLHTVSDNIQYTSNITHLLKAPALCIGRIPTPDISITKQARSNDRLTALLLKISL